MKSKQLLPAAEVAEGGGYRYRWDRVGLWFVLHAAAVAAVFNFHWSVLVPTVLMFFVTGCLGITIGFHRLLAHASFKTFRFCRFLFLLSASLSFFGGPIDWVGHHRRHHGHTEDSKDPHTPREGFWWAHFEWFFVHHPFAAEQYAQDLKRDRMCVWFDRFWFIPPLLSFGVLYLVGQWSFHEGLAWVLWAGAFRMVLMFHVTGFVNSWTHKWGYRNFDTPDDSRNSALIALFTFGEGWHNNHHASQRCAAHGRKRFELDVSYGVIRFFEAVRLAWDVVHPGDDVDRRSIERPDVRGGGAEL